MTDIEVLLNNIYTLGFRGGGVLLGIWGLYIFFRSLFGEAGRNPVRIVMSVLLIVAGAAIFQMLPQLIETGKNTGGQIGGGGYGMHQLVAPLDEEQRIPEPGAPA
jgi:hypothetical protein